ncbi:TolC family protein [Methylibium sp.]|uniref:TolC family protein n=1 Tax=Methylibium sp. TaxID=2067992 RepID=UPI003D09E9B4
MRSKTLAHAIAMAAAAVANSAFLFIPIASQAQPVPPAQASAPATATLQELTLQQALTQADAANPALKTKQAQLAAAEGAQTDANALLSSNPQLSVDQTRRSVPQAGLGSETRREWSAGISQTLEIGGQRGHRRDAAAAALSALRSEIEDARRVARTAASERFHHVLALQQRVALEAEAGKLFDDTAAAIQKRRAAGEDTKLDANIATVEAERARNQLALAQEQLLDARTELAASLQLPPGSLPQAVGEMVLPQSKLTLGELMASVEAQPRLRALQDRENSATAKLRLEQASVYPDVTVGLNVGREGPNDGRERLTTVTVSVPLPLFKRNASGIGQARTDLSQVQIERETALRDARASVSSLWLKLTSLESRVRRLQGTMLPALADNQQLSLKSQRAGQIGLLELIVVNRQALDARRDLNDALADYHATRHALEAAAGLALEGNQP